MKKTFVALALAALALSAYASGNRPDELKPAVAAAQGAASAAAADRKATGADRDAAATSAKDAASSARQSSISAATAIDSEAKAATDAERAEKAAAKAARAAAKQQAAAQQTGYVWRHFGVDKYAKSRAEAMTKRHDVFAAMGLPPAVIERFMKATEEEGTLTAIANGQKLDVMFEGSGMRRDVLVDLEASLVPAAEVWETTFNGTTYKLYLPKICNNWSLVKELPRMQITGSPALAAPPATSSACPQGWTLIANAWNLDSLPSSMRAEAQSLISAAQARESDNARRLEPYKPDAVSRTMGRRLREQVKTRAPVDANITVRFLDPRTGAVVRELGSLHVVSGMGTFRFAEDPRPFVVETLWPPEFLSPTVSGGQSRLRLFGYEWKSDCAMNEHGIVQGH
jgi:hypothetical protein